MLWMRSLSLLFASLLVAAAALAQEPSSAEVFHDAHAGRFAGARHVILDPQHVLSAAERAALASRGVEILRATSGGRYLARVAPDAAIAGFDPLIRSIQPITAERKLSASAVHETARGNAFARLNILFHDDVTLEQARAAVEAAGGTVDRPFDTDFELPRNLQAHVPSQNVPMLAADERVLTIAGPRPRIAVENLDEGQTSHVDVVQTAPYNLDGSGVVLSYFELSPGDASHPEFGGRLITHFPSGAGTSDQDHATHTAGTMIAAGNQSNPSSPLAKGMAPAATLHGYCVSDACSNSWLNDKNVQLHAVGSVADNNSWGFILGWTRDGSTGWTWTGNDEYIGAYDSTDAALDKISRTGTTLMVHSAGNEGSTTGPTSAPFAHNHTDDSGSTNNNEIFCYSQDGSGTDCPAPPTCTAGISHCETVRHPVHGTVGSIGLTASAKNVIAVGATDSGKNVTTFSSRGPTRDGRVKPDITARGLNVLSTLPNNNYGRESGTSMAAPVVTGISALLTQQWRKEFNANPLPVTLKALLIAGAVDTGNPGPDYTNGFGFVDAKNSVDVLVADNAQGKRINIGTIDQGGQTDLPLSLSGTGNVRVVLVWNDPEVLGLDPNGTDISDIALVNDLDLVVRDPNGNDVLPYVLDPANPGASATRGVNTRDNVEEVEIAGATAGTYHVIVKGKRVVQNAPQQFVVVSTAGTLGQSAPPCSDPTEPNDSAAQAFGYIGSGQKVTARFCEASDVDFFKIHVDRAGPLTVTVTTTGTPVTVTLTGSGITGGTASIGASGTGVVTASVVTPGDYIVEVVPNGALANDTSYTVAPLFTTSAPGRTHAARP
jgi:subtilisin family serine protease